MSVINDALKEVQIKNQGSMPPPVPGQGPRPAEPVESDRPDSRLTLSATMYLVVLLTFVLLGVFLLRMLNHHNILQAKAAAPPTTASAVPAPQKHLKLGQPVGASPGTSLPASGMTNAAPLFLPPPLKLQAVFFNPAKPSAIIAGTTVFVGDRIRQYRVTEILRDSVTLVSESEKKVLKLQ